MNRKNNIKRKLSGLDDDLETEIHLDSLRATFKKVPDAKTPWHETYTDSGLKKNTFIHERHALEMNRY